MKHARRPLIVGTLCAAAVFALGPQTVRGNTMTLTVTASIANVCQFNTSAATIAFGAYDPIVTNHSTPITYTGFAPSYACTSGDSTYTWAFASGNASGGNCRMSDGAGHFLNYSISDGTTTTYCAGAAHAAAAEAAATGSTQTYTAFVFTLPAAQNEPANSYSDTNTLTISP